MVERKNKDILNGEDERQTKSKSINTNIRFIK
jgi:hypothetical protein